MDPIKKIILVDFLPATFSDGKECTITFYAKDPGTDRLRRKRIKLNRVRQRMTATEFKKYYTKLVHEINIRLTTGWNPFVEQEAPKGFVKLIDAIATWRNSKERESRKNSIRSYKSYEKTLKVYLEDTMKQPGIFVVNFDRRAASDFMQHLWTKKSITPRTYNNYRNMYITLWNWMKEFNYSKDNVFEPIHKKKTQGKNRDFINAETRNRIKSHLEKADPHFLVCCLMAFHSLLRPGEITGIKRKHILIDKQLIFVEADVAKNGHSRWAIIPDAMLPYMRHINLEGNPEEYIFSTDFEPGKNRMDSRKIAKKWEALRKELELTMREKFYSLRDSGIVQMLQDGISPESIRKLADHHSLEMTSIYAKHLNPEADNILKTRSSGF